MALAASPERTDLQVHLRLTQAQLEMVTQLCGVFGLSARSVYNASLRYALHCAEQAGVSPACLPEYPRRQLGQEVAFELTAETLSKAHAAGVLDRIPACTVAGIKLLFGHTLEKQRHAS
jgi:hypothetical protein